MSTITNETLINHLRKGQVDQFNALRMSSSESKISFFAEDFSNLQLQNVNLSNCDLRKCDFSNSNLSKANISRSNCNEADFSGCTMSAMFVENVQLNEAYFEQTKIENSEFYHCFIEQAEFVNVSFTQTNLEGCSLKRSSFQNCNFEGMHANESKFSRSKIDSSDFTKSSFQSCKFPHTELHRCTFLHTTMTESLFVYTDFTTSSIEDCRFTNSNFYAAEWGEIQIQRCDFSKCDVSEMNASPMQFVNCDFTSTQGSHQFTTPPVPQLKFPSPMQPSLSFGLDCLLLFWKGEEFLYTMMYHLTSQKESKAHTFPIPKDRLLYVRPIPTRTGWNWICVEQRKSNNYLLWLRQDFSGDFHFVQEHKFPIQLQPTSIQHSMNAYPVKGGFLLYCIEMKLIAIHWKEDQIVEGITKKYCYVHPIGIPTAHKIFGRGKPVLLSKGGGITPIDILKTNDLYQVPEHFEHNNFMIERQGKHIVLGWCTYQEDESGNQKQQKGLHVYDHYDDSASYFLHPNDIVQKYAIALSKGKTWIITQIEGRKLDHSPLEEKMGMDLPKDLPPDVISDIFAEFREDFGDFQPKMASVAAQPEIHIHNLKEDTSTQLFGDLGMYGDEIDLFVTANKGSVLFVNLEGGIIIFDVREKEPLLLWERE
jgi:uncharacterized protein YjbI with pentapeptide repeats